MVCIEDCGIHGQCMDNSCVCDKHWSGKTDFLNYDGFACVTYVPFERVLWAVVLLVGFRPQLRIIYVMVKHLPRLRHERNRAAKKGKKLRYRDAPFLQLSLISQFQLCSIIVIAIFHVFDMESRVIGYDIGVSIAFLIYSTANFAGNSKSELLAFDVLSSGLDFGPQKHSTASLRRTLILETSFANIMYAIILLPILIYGCFFQANLTNPQKSAMRYLLVFKNLGVVLYFMSHGVIALQVARKVKRLRGGSSDLGTSPASKKIAAFLEHLETSSKEKVRAGISVSISFIVFSLPWLWPYQTIQMAFLAILLLTSKFFYINQFLASQEKVSKRSSKLPSVSPLASVLRFPHSLHFSSIKESSMNDRTQISEQSFVIAETTNNSILQNTSEYLSQHSQCP